jgi:hypothetical protein
MKKYTDVDIIAELQKLVDSHVDSYKEDFDIDKRIIRRAAESQNPEDKTLMWFCRPHGTHCLNENQVFIQGTRDHNTFRFYAEQTYDECIARVIVPKAVKRGKVFGDVFEINYREQAANVAQNSVAPDHDRLTFADGFVLRRMWSENIFWTLLTAVLIGAAILYGIVLLYAFPLLARFENTTFGILKTAFLVGVRYLFCTLLMAAIYGIMGYVIVFVFTPAFLLGMGLCAMLCSFLMLRILYLIGGDPDAVHEEYDHDKN